MLSLSLSCLLILTAPFAHGQKFNDITALITKEAEFAGISPRLAIAIAQTESALNPDALGTDGEIGLFQIHPKFHNFPKLHNPKYNARAAMKILVEYRQLCKSYGKAYFVCFNVGPNYPLKHPHLHRYYKRVMRNYAKL